MSSGGAEAEARERRERIGRPLHATPPNRDQCSSASSPSPCVS